MHDNQQTLTTIRQTAWTGLIVNIALAACKCLCGIIGCSQVIIADALHTLSDTATDIAVLTGAKYWTKPPDACHPYGHQRIETLITAGIGLSLACVAGGLTANACASLYREAVHTPGWIAFYAALLSIGCKEALYRWSVNIGRRIRSPGVIANAQHQRSDALSSIPAALAVAAAAISPQLWFIDTVGAIVVSLLIARAAWDIGWPALRELVDAGAPDTDRTHIKQLALAVEGVRDAHAIRTRYAGAGLHIDLHVLVDPNITVSAGHTIADTVKQHLLTNGPRVVDIIIHIEPFTS
ncbi:MAG: cation transporter [Deltaproteobacteria bacterium]|nr:cation transporter [Deltaproteobacteria bacterium]